ncbi:matrix metalloproteinase-20 [Colossoma macropomum]|uniref:matrix metalloproteinase-20 n=1 Tax=Colossoma macropomum TaxID=42526 RepID=UPI001864D30E|nr:matrix metalloproteinase-20 [Colossoma macropomum]
MLKGIPSYLHLSPCLLQLASFSASVSQSLRMGIWVGLACACAVIALQCLAAPLLQLKGENVISREDGKTQNDLILADKYLQLFYSFQAGPTSRRKRSHPSFSSKLKDMQSFFRLNQTGSLNPETLAVMKTPRCGVPDIQDYVSNRGNRWKKTVISYRVGRYTSDLPVTTVDSLIASALDVWAKASPLRFFRSHSQQADIVVEFATRNHGDSFPFDGPRGTLAHAFDPGEGIGGDVHFDDDELWTAGSNGFNLYLVAAHEFGHALGLRHSQNPESLMYPTYKLRKPHNLLSSEDIININTLYGPSIQRPYYPRLSWSYPFNPWYTGSYFPMGLKDKCNPDLSFDSVTTLGDAILFFKGRYLWIKHNNKNDIKEGPINNFMPNINSKIDAAYWVPQRSTAYLFSGSDFWTVKGSQVKGRRKNISSLGFPAWVERIDAALHVHKTVYTLFFTQNLYWRYNESQKVMEDSYPRSISDDFPGINKTISAAVHKYGFLHFFLGPEVYKYDMKLKKVIGVSKANSWLGC